MDNPSWLAILISLDNVVGGQRGTLRGGDREEWQHPRGGRQNRVTTNNNPTAHAEIIAIPMISMMRERLVKFPAWEDRPSKILY